MRATSSKVFVPGLGRKRRRSGQQRTKKKRKKEKRKRKSGAGVAVVESGDNLGRLALGSTSSDIAIWDLATGKVFRE